MRECEKVACRLSAVGCRLRVCRFNLVKDILREEMTIKCEDYSGKSGESKRIVFLQLILMVRYLEHK